MGLEELKELSIAMAKDAVESACYQGIFKNISSTSNKKFNKLKQVVNEKIQEKVRLIIGRIESERKLETLTKDVKEIFIYILDSYLSLKLSSSNEEYNINKYTYSLEGEKMITDLINDYFTFCEDLTKNYYKTILEEKIKILVDKIREEQSNFNIANKNTLEMKYRDIIQLEVAPKIDNILKNKANAYYLKNAFNIFLEFLNKYVPFCFFAIFYRNNLKKLEKEDKEMKEMIIKNIRIQFEELEEKIKQYNQKMVEKRKKEIEEKRKRKDQENGMEMTEEMRKFLEDNNN